MRIRMIISLGVLALSNPLVRGGAVADRSTFDNIAAKSSDIFLGVASSLTYSEEDNSLKLSNERDWLYYKVSMLPIRVLKGDINEFDKYEEVTGKEVTVFFRDRSPFADTGGTKVCCRPEVGNIYIVFLNKTKSTTYKLSDERVGILPIHFDLVVENEKDIWKLLIETVRNEDMPLVVHESMFSCLRNYGLQMNEIEQLLSANIEYFEKYEELCRQKTVNAKKLKTDNIAVESSNLDIPDSRSVMNELSD